MSHHVAVNFDPAWRPYLRPLSLGFARYVRERTTWQVTPLVVFAHSSNERFQPLDSRPFDGVVAGVRPENRERMARHPLPIVLVSPEGMDVGRHWVGPDYQEIGRMGAADLHERGARSLIYFRHGGQPRPDLVLIERGFTEYAERVGLRHVTFDRGPRTAARGSWYYADQQADLIDLLGATTPPIGVLCGDDDHAWRALEICQLAGLRVPDVVTILGIGNDEFVCELARPMLSSIRIDQEAVGYKVGQTLDALLHGRDVPRRQTAGLPVIETRQSTGYVTTDDPDVIKAVRFIRDNIGRPLSHGQIADAAGVGERTLLRRFKAELNRTPMEELRRQRLERALHLIRSTDQPLADIALRCGYGQQSALGRAVKAVTGRTPGQIRRR